MNEKLQAAEVFPPGDFIREELEARGWTQSDLAAIIGSSPRHVNELVSSKRSITPDSARRLAEAFGTSAEFWLRLEGDYQLARTQPPDNRISKRAQLYDRAPIAEMARRGWIERSNDVDYLGRQVLAFYGISKLSDSADMHGIAARARATKYTPSQEAWFCRARQLGSAVSASSYTTKKLDSAVTKLRGYMQDAENVRHVPSTLAEAGVRFVVVEHTKSSRIDGAAFWLDRSTPLVALSMRYDKLDSFWHTLMHELGHIRLKHASTIDVSLIGPDACTESRSAADAEADHWAEEAILSRAALDNFIARVHPLYSRSKVEAFAARQQVHPSIVLGQLKHLGKVRWQNLTNLHPRVRGIICEAALCDGWGQQVPIGRLEQ